MKVLGLAWLGLRTDKFDETVSLIRNVMGLEVVRDEPAVVGFRMHEQAAMEVYRPDDEFHAFFTTGPVVGFLVDDVDQARAEMEAAGIEFIGPIQRSPASNWNHFRAPDGTVFEIISRNPRGARQIRAKPKPSSV